MKEIIQGHWAIDADTDVVWCEDTSRFHRASVNRESVYSAEIQ